MRKNLFVCVFFAAVLGGSVVSGQLEDWEFEAANATAVDVVCKDDMNSLCSGSTVCGFGCSTGTPPHIISWF